MQTLEDALEYNDIAATQDKKYVVVEANFSDPFPSPLFFLFSDKQLTGIFTSHQDLNKALDELPGREVWRSYNELHFRKEKFLEEFGVNLYQSLSVFAQPFMLCQGVVLDKAKGEIRYSIQDFGKWIECKPDSFTAIGSSCDHCPNALFLEAQGLNNVSVGVEAADYQGAVYRIPKWASELSKWASNHFPATISKRDILDYLSIEHGYNSSQPAIPTETTEEAMLVKVKMPFKDEYLSIDAESKEKLATVLQVLMNTNYGEAIYVIDKASGHASHIYTRGMNTAYERIV